MIPDYMKMSTAELCEVLTTTVGGPLACQAADRLQTLHLQLDMRGSCKLPVGENDGKPLEIFGSQAAIDQVRAVIVQFQRLTEENTEQQKSIREGKEAMLVMDNAVKEISEKRDSLQEEVKRLTAETALNYRAVGKTHKCEVVAPSSGPYPPEVPHDPV